MSELCRSEPTTGRCTGPFPRADKDSGRRGPETALSPSNLGGTRPVWLSWGDSPPTCRPSAREERGGAANGREHSRPSVNETGTETNGSIDRRSPPGVLLGVALGAGGIQP